MLKTGSLWCFPAKPKVTGYLDALISTYFFQIYVSLAYKINYGTYESNYVAIYSTECCNDLADVKGRKEKKNVFLICTLKIKLEAICNLIKHTLKEKLNSHYSAH